jgi:hypothetical protein
MKDLLICGDSLQVRRKSPNSGQLKANLMITRHL